MVGLGGVAKMQLILWGEQAFFFWGGGAIPEKVVLSGISQMCVGLFQIGEIL